jgi:CheY-like chemotaxis protein
MTALAQGQPAIALVDDDDHSARLLTRMLAAHDGPPLTRYASAAEAFDRLAPATPGTAVPSPCLVLVDLKSSSAATRDFIAKLRHRAPDLLVIAMAPTLDRAVRDGLLDAGAAAVFERHADLSLYRREAAAIVAFWVRSQRLDPVGT